MSAKQISKISCGCTPRFKRACAANPLIAIKIPLFNNVEKKKENGNTI